MPTSWSPPEVGCPTLRARTSLRCRRSRDERVWHRAGALRCTHPERGPPPTNRRRQPLAPVAAQRRTTAWRRTGQARLRPDARPSGERPTATAARRFVVQRHRAQPAPLRPAVRDRRRAGQLGGAEGPDARPEGRRLAVHVEDHPLEYLRLRGRDPVGRVRRRRRDRLGHRARGSRTRTTTPRRGRAPGSSTPSCTATRLRGPFVLVRRERGGPARRGAVAAAAQARRARRRRLGPRGPPDVGAERPDQRRGTADPDRLWRSDAAGRGGRRRAAQPEPLPDAGDRTSSTTLGRGGTWEVFGRRSRGSPTSTRCCSRPAGEQPVTKRELIRVRRPDRTGRRCRTCEGRPLNLHRYPEGAEATRASGTSSGPDTPPSGSAAVGEPGGRPEGDDHGVRRRRRACRAGLGGELRRARVAPLDVADRDARARRTP